MATPAAAQAPLRVLIAGGGVAGPCLAYWLTRAKLPAPPEITVIERAPAPRTQGQAIDIRDAAVPIIRRMGLEQAIRAQTTPEQGLEFIGMTGKPIARFGQTGDVENQAMTSEYEILRADLARVFIDATRERKGVRYVFGQRVASITQPETDGPVTVSFTGDMPDTSYDLVVAADGAMSATRQAIFGPDDPAHFRFLSAYYAFFSIPYDKELDEPPLWRWYHAPGGIGMATRPHNDPATSGVFIGINLPKPQKDEAMEQALTQDVPAQKELFKKVFANAGWQAQRICDAIDGADDFYMTPVTQVRIPRWSKGRCVCLGDAAWGPTFITGAGTSLAIEGAYLLAGELGLAQGNVPQALDKFEHGYRPYVVKTQDIPSFLPQALAPVSKTALKLRDLAVTVAGMAPGMGALKRMFAGKPRLPRDFDWVDEEEKQEAK